MNKLILPLTLAAIVMGSFQFSNSNYMASQIDAQTPESPKFVQFQETKSTIGALTSGANIKAHESDIAGTFEKGTGNNFFEQIKGYIGHNTETNKAIEVDFRPDISSNVVVLGNGSTTSGWGVACSAQNSCTSTTQKCDIGTKYLNEGYTCDIGRTNIYFSKDLSYSKLADQGLNVRFSAVTNTTWPLENTALLGMGPKSEYLTYVLNNWDIKDNKYEFSFFYDVLLKDNRFDADKAKTFDITMTNFGEKTGNAQDSVTIQTIEQNRDLDMWYLPISELSADTNASVLPQSASAVLVNAGNEYIALPKSQRDTLISQIKIILQCEPNCTRSKFNEDSEKYHTTYVNLVVTLDTNNLNLRIPIFDLIYYKDTSTKDDNLQYSIGDLETWINLGVVPAGTTMAMGRQFLINTWLTFVANNNGARSIKIGQLSDMGKITTTERLWLLLFGCGIVFLILVALLIKVIGGKRKTGNGSDYNEVENSQLGIQLKGRMRKNGEN